MNPMMKKLTKSPGSPAQNAQAHTRAGAETVAETTDTQTKNEL